MLRIPSAGPAVARRCPGLRSWGRDWEQVPSAGYQSEADLGVQIKVEQRNVHVLIYAYMYIYIYVHIHTHINTETRMYI